MEHRMFGRLPSSSLVFAAAALLLAPGCADGPAEGERVQTTRMAVSAPVVVVTSPTEAAAETTLSGVVLAASALDADDAVASVAFLADGAPIGSGVDLGGGVYGLVWSAATAGVHAITATATDASGLASTSAPVSVTVTTKPPVCTTTVEAANVKSALKQAVSCNQLKLTAGPGAACQLTPPPACAGAMVADATALVSGANNPAAAAVDVTTTGLKKQYDCQIEIFRATYNYVGSELTALAQGQTPAQAAATAAASWSLLPSKCTAVPVALSASGVTLPSVGPACAAFVGPVGSVVDPSGLVACLGGALDAMTVAVGPYQPPIVAVLGPAAGSTHGLQSTIALSAAARDIAGTVSAVSFHDNGTLLGAGTLAATGLYTLAWPGAAPGPHLVTAVATDSAGLVTTSSSVAVLVAFGTPPVVALTGPQPLATFASGAAVTMTATATDPDGVVTAVDFYADGVHVAAGSPSGGAAFSAVFQGAAAGAHALTVVATDDDGLVATSPAVSITLSAPVVQPLQCTQAFEGSTIKTSLKSYVNCNQAKLTTGPGTACALTAPPACAGTIVADATALADGVNNPPAAAVSTTAAGSKKQLDCQNAINKAVSDYVGDKMALMTAGQTPAQAEALAAAAFAVLPGRCTSVPVKQDASGVVLPQVGPQCAAFIGPVGAIVDVAGLTPCLHTTLETFIKQIGNYKSPTVAVTSPAPGAALASPADVTLSAAAADADGTVSSVTFFVDGVFVAQGALVGGSYDAVWSAAPAGAHAITAVATDSDALVTTSVPVAVTVALPPPNQAPTITLTGPAEGAQYPAGAPVIVTASATDADGTVTGVAFHADGVLIGAGVPSGGSISSAALLGAAAGVHTLTAVATDDGGLTATSAPITVTVAPAAPPVPQCTLPADGVTFKSALKSVISCNQSKLTQASPVCAITAPPACAGSIVAEGIVLANGVNNPPAGLFSPTGGQKRSYDCQVAINKAVYDYAGDMMTYLTAGQTPAQAEAQASLAFVTMTSKCASTIVKQDASGVVLPEVGPPCAAYVGPVGALVDLGGLTNCLHTTLAGYVKSIANYQAPTVALTSPASGAAFNQAASVTLSATAADADGTVAGVTFFVDGVAVGPGALSLGAYTLAWAATPPGMHAITAVAVDGDELATTSAPAIVTVLGVGLPPAVAVTSPAAGSVLVAGSVDLVATALDADGSVLEVQFHVDGQSIGDATSLGGGAFGATWLSATAGSHTLTAVAVDNDGLSTTSAPVVVGVEAAAVGPCSAPAEAAVLAQALAEAVACDVAALDGTSSVCSASAPPACAATLVHDAVALAFGPNDPASSAATDPSLVAQLGCQVAIGAAVRDYVSLAMTARVQGQTAAQAEAAATPALLGVGLSCAGVPVGTSAGGVVVPAVGPQCAAAVGAAGSVVDTASLATCLQTLLSVWVERVGPSPAPLRPNVIVVMTDDQRWDLLDSTHSGSGLPITPQIAARITGEGLDFQNAYATTPLCTPSRTSILTGQYAHNTGVHGNAAPYGGALTFDDTQTLALWLQAAGYRTSLMGKYVNEYSKLWAPGATPYTPPGWDDWHAYQTTLHYGYKLVENGSLVSYGTAPTDYATDVLRDKANAFINQSAQMGQPFFLYVGIYAPHLPFTPAPRHTGMFAGLAGFRPPSFNELDMSDKPAWMTALPLLTAAEIQQIDDDGRAQLEMMQAVDEAVGGSQTYGITGILDTLEANGILDDTMVIFMSDHGYLWGEHRVTGKMRTYEEAARMSLQVRYPRLVPLARTESRVALNIDLSPTILELAGGVAALPQDGESLVRVLDGTGTTTRTDWMQEAWVNQPANSDFAGVHDGTWKYAEFVYGPAELYDLSVDPEEMVNVAGLPQNAARVAAMAARLRELRPSWPVDVP